MSKFGPTCSIAFFDVAVMRTEFPYSTSINDKFLSTILTDDNVLLASGDFRHSESD